MDRLHHASWHLLREQKQKVHVRRYSKAHIGVQLRASERWDVQLKELQTRVQAANLAMQIAAVQARG